jgi:hypothetical protein
VRRNRLEPAVPVGADPRRYARVLAEVHSATLAGEPAPARSRALISDSWARVRRHGVDPDRGTDAEPISTEELERRRRESGLADVLPVLRAGLVTVADEAAHIMVVVDAAGRVLWRDGCSAVRRRADGLGFVEPSAPRWSSSARSRSTRPSTSSAPTTPGPARRRRSVTRGTGGCWA